MSMNFVDEKGNDIKIIKYLATQEQVDNSIDARINDGTLKLLTSDSSKELLNKISEVTTNFSDYTNEIVNARQGSDGTTYDTFGEAIREQIKSSKEIKISDTKPDNSDSSSVWINTKTNEKNINIPEINDDETSAVDTWSSSKINTELNKATENVVYFKVDDKTDSILDVIRAENILTNNGKTVEDRLNELDNSEIVAKYDPNTGMVDFTKGTNSESVLMMNRAENVLTSDNKTVEEKLNELFDLIKELSERVQ